MVMMKSKFLFLGMLAVLFVGCSSEENDNPDENPSISNHFPLNTENSWTYNNETAYQDGTVENSQETISVASSTETQGVTYYTLESDALPMDQGFVTGLLTNGELTAAESQLIFDGEWTEDLNIFGLTNAGNLTIPLSNIILYDINANIGDVLSEKSDEFTQDINIQGADIPFTFVYTITSTQEEFLESYTVGDQSFEDVISAEVVVNIEIYANYFVNIPILNSQDAIVIKNYYANNVGLIFSTTDVNYQFENINLPTFPEIEDISVDFTQEIDSYTIAE